MWTGVYVLCTPVFAASTSGWGWATVLSPVLTFLILMLLSGMPTAEGDNQRRYMRTPQARAAFLAYRSRTSPLVPLPPPLYEALPLGVKRWALCEWKMYECTEGEGGEGNAPDESTSVVVEPFVTKAKEAAVGGVAAGKSTVVRLSRGAGDS